MKTLNHINYFKVGDFVQCLTTILFADGSEIKKGEVLKITEDTLDFYNFYTDEYCLFLRKF